MANNKPTRKMSYAGVSCSVFENQVQTKTGQKTFESVTVQRTYKDKEEQWQHTNSFPMDKIPVLVAQLNSLYAEHVSRAPRQAIASEGAIDEEEVI